MKKKHWNKERKKENFKRKKESHMASAQRYPMPCLEWLVEEMEWKQGSGGGFRSNFPWYSMGALHFLNSLLFCHVIQWKFLFFFLSVLPYYPMGNMHFSTFLLIFHVIQWEVCIFSISMLWKGNLRLEKLWGDGRMNGWMDGQMYV